jgi:adenylate cyclase
VPPTSQQDFELGPFRLDRRGRSLTRDGAPVSLGGRALDVLVVLASAAGETVGKDALLDQVWPGLTVEENNLQVQISALRKALGEGWIVTVPGRGYRLTVPPAGAGDERPGVQSPGLPAPLPDKPSIAVLPFANMSSDPDQEYFSDGIADDIITELSRSRSLLVIARNSSFTYKGHAVDVKQVARELGVRYVVEGSVRRSGGRVRVTAQLIDAGTGNHLWAQRYDRDLADIFAVQDDITNAVALAIGPAIADAEQQRVARRPPESLGAWDACVRGQWHLARTDPAENEKARSFFNRAIDLDPNLSPAYQGLVYTYLDEIRLFATRSLDETGAVVEPLARRAVALDPNDSGAHAALGWVLSTRGDHAASVDRSERALALNPNSADAYRLKGVSLVFAGRHQDGYQTLVTHLRLNPRDPGNWRALHLIAIAHYLQGDHEGAVAACRRAMHENPNQRLSLRWLVAAHAQAGRLAEAQDILREMVATLPPAWFNAHWLRKWPWMREEDHAALLDGLRKVGWQGLLAT